jgi:hypothetical protein
MFSKHIFTLTSCLAILNLPKPLVPLFVMAQKLALSLQPTYLQMVNELFSAT